MNLGVLAHLLGKQPAAELAKTVSAHGFSYVQLALAKALTDVDSANGKLSPGLGNWIAEQFDRQGVRIAVLGCYINPIHPDKDVRRAELDRFKEHIKYARDFGCSMVATETGSLTTYQDTHPGDYEEVAYRILKESVEELTEEAEKWGVNVAIEPVAVHTLHTPAHMVSLFDEIPSSNLGMLFDPCNLMKLEYEKDQEQFLRDVFEQLYSRMIVIHAKDFYFENGQKLETVAGRGALNYPLFFQLLKQYKPHIHISLEGIKAEDAKEAADFLRQTWSNS